MSLVKSAPRTKDLFAMIPGVRSVASDAQDQARVASPAETLRAGADLLVIGRQITEAADPVAAYEELVTEIEGAL